MRDREIKGGVGILPQKIWKIDMLLYACHNIFLPKCIATLPWRICITVLAHNYSRCPSVLPGMLYGTFSPCAGGPKLASSMFLQASWRSSRPLHIPSIQWNFKHKKICKDGNYWPLHRFWVHLSFNKRFSRTEPNFPGFVLKFTNISRPGGHQIKFKDNSRFLGSVGSLTTVNCPASLLGCM